MMKQVICVFLLIIGLLGCILHVRADEKELTFEEEMKKDPLYNYSKKHYLNSLKRASDYLRRSQDEDSRLLEEKMKKNPMYNYSNEHYLNSLKRASDHLRSSQGKQEEEADKRPVPHNGRPLTAHY